MARRKKSSLGLVWIIAGIAILVIAFVGSQFLFSGGGDPYRTIQPLDVSAYLENSNSLRGNVYKVDGEVANSLARSPKEGRLFSISVNDGAEILPILVTTDFNSTNIQKGQHFIFEVEVDQNGMLETKSLTKS